MPPISRMTQKFSLRKQCRFMTIQVLLLLPVTGTVRGDEPIGRFGVIGVKDGRLVVNFQIEDLFQNEHLSGMKKGVTAAIQYKIQLWQDRRRWFDRMITEERIRMKVLFDKWEKRFVVVSSDNRLASLTEEDMQQQCTRLSDFILYPVENLNPKTVYYVVVKAILQPMSIENVEEIKRWLQGEVESINPKSIREGKSPGEKLGEWVVNLALNLTGFGEREVDAQSERFSGEDLRPLPLSQPTGSQESGQPIQ